MSAIPPAGDSDDDTVRRSCHEGIALALAARESGDWKPVVDWLAGHPHCAGEVLAFVSGDQGVERLMAPLRVPTAPTAVGKYQLRDKLGEGGMAVVFKAFDPTLNRDVAVKLLRPGRELSADDRARFRFEAEAMGGLSHDHVVRVYDFGEADGVPYLVMALLTGGSLDKWLKGLGPDRQLKPKQAAEIARDIALGIHHAHQQGLIHRDLKPGNILRNDAGRVMVADFGLARPVDLTATNLAGTVAYMAPEQAGRGKRLTTAVDVHAVGVILFELLAGGPPFGGDFASVLRQVAEEPAPPVRTYRPAVPRDLEAVVAKCLEKKPEDRYPSAAALADDLDNFTHGRPVTAGERGLFTDVVRAFSYRSEPQSQFTWRGFFIGSVSTAFALTWIQAALLLDVPRWVSWAGLGYYLTSWAVILWAFLGPGRRHLRPVDRAHAFTHIGMYLGALALTPVCLWLHAGDVSPLFAPLLVVIGLGLFAGGKTMAGRYYLEGGLIVLTAALLPLVPVKFWPGVYGLTLTLSQLWHGISLRRFDRESRAAPSS